jgi:nucleotide-binding universal stress UspA family protein
MNKILIPTDFSLTSEKAYKIALTFANNTGAELVFIHIVPREKRKRLSVNFSAVANISEYDVNDEIAAAESMLSLIPANPIFKGLKVSTALVSDTLEDIPTAIATYVENNEIDLVITGTDIKRTTRKNYAPVLVRIATCPVIIVEQNVEDEIKLKNLVLATDFENVNYKMMDKIWAIQDCFDSKLTILYVNTPNHFKDTLKIENEYNMFVSKYELENTSLSVFNDHNLENGILKYIEREKTDLLMMSTHGRRGLSSLFNESHSEYIVGHVQVPVYVHNLHTEKGYFNSGPDLGSFNFNNM